MRAYFGYGRDFPSAALFPRTVGLPGLALSLVVLAAEIRQVLRRAVPVEAKAKPVVDLRPAQRRTFSMMGWLTGFFAGIWLLGFIGAAPVMTFLYLKAGAREKWLISLALALLSWGFFYGLFDWAIRLPFPVGALIDWG